MPKVSWKKGKKGGSTNPPEYQRALAQFRAYMQTTKARKDIPEWKRRQLISVAQVNFKAMYPNSTDV
jgi:penicillin V acylase-like amidase (Ntn superfamily)